MGNRCQSNAYAEDTQRKAALVTRNKPIHNGSVLNVFAHDASVLTCSDDKLIATTPAGSLSAASPESMYFEGHSKAVNKAIINGELLWSISRDLSIRQWNLQSRKCTHVFENAHELNISSVVSRPDGSAIFTGSRDYHVRGWDAERLAAFSDFSAPRNIVTALAMDPRGDLVYQSSEDLCIRVWDSRSSSRVPSKHITGYVYFALCLSLSPTNEHIIASGCKGFDGVGSEVKIFDLRATAKPLCNLSFHRHDVTGCSFTPDGTHLVSASKDGSICAWNVAAAGAEERAVPVASHVTHAKLYTSISVGNSPAGAQSHPLFVGAFDGSVSAFSLDSRAGADPLLLPGNSSQPFFADGFDDSNES